MTQGEERRAVPKMVITSLIQWRWKLTTAQRRGLETSEWIRWGRLQLGLDMEQTTVTYGGMTRRIAPPEAVADLQLTCPDVA